MDINRRNFLGKSLLLGGGVSLTTYALSKVSPIIIQTPENKINTKAATYQNTRHNRQFYQNSRF